MTGVVYSSDSRVSRLIAGAVAVIVVIGGILSAPLAAHAAEAVPDGLSSETAAASCWEIKQNDPASKDGVYWLVTPALVFPQQFYCDQTSFGGGWVMIGRGREGWKENYNGLGAPAQITANPTGVAAFKPAQLPAKTVDGLLNGGRPDALPADSIRVKRASAADGSRWQEVRFSLARRDRWNWTLSGGNPIKDWIFGGYTGTGGWTGTVGWGAPDGTAGFGQDDGWNGSFVAERATHKYLEGWSYGSTITGQDSPTSYMWAPAGQGYAIPFAQMFVRPQLKLADLDFGTMPQSGTEATTLRSVPDSDAMKTVWGVSGLANGRSGEANVEVAEFGQVGDTVFAGGNFQYVQQTRDGSGKAEQPYIAGFDVRTGEWISTFRPKLDGQVKAIVGLPDGRVAIGGQFTMVNGVPQAGLAILDPVTGQLSGWQVAAENRTIGGLPYIHDLDAKNGFLYVSGALTHLTAVGSTTSASTWNGGRIDLSIGRPDTNWNPNLNGTTIAADLSEQGDRAYFAGYFTRKQNARATSGTALQTAAGAPLVEPMWTPTFSESTVDANGDPQGYLWQNGVADVGGRVYLGGSQHSLFGYDRETFALKSGSITHSGGDVQSVEDNGSIVIAGCHCSQQTYQDKYLKKDFSEPWSEVDKINLAGAWDAVTGDYIPDWSPVIKSRAGQGVWGSFFDSTGALWIGGDLTDSMSAGAVNQWSGGFIRFAPRDSTSPTTPGAMTSTPNADATSATLTWGASTDAAKVTYEILRGNRVVATTTSTSYTLPLPTLATDYFVRARDVVGNRSASTAAFVMNPPSASALTLVANGDTWSWRYSSDPLPAGWNATAFDASSWQSGNALFGRGVSVAKTNIDPTAPATPLLSAQFRKTFQVDDAASMGNTKVSVIANDGAVVFINGIEVGRVRMPGGAITQNTTATAAVSNATASGARSVFTVPQGVLTDGPNVIAVSVHANYRATADLGFDAALTAERVTPPAAVSGLAATATTETVTLSWAAPVGGTAPTSYAIARDGKQVGSTTAPTVTFTDTGLTGATTFAYAVTAVAADGSSSAPATVSVTTREPVEPAVSVPSGASWSWRYSSDALPAEWNAVGFDASGWAMGSALLGRGVPGAVTDIDPLPQATKPLSAQFRTTFELADAASVKDGTVTVIADDGVVVYLNGVELGRKNLPAGTVTPNTYATAAPRSSAAAAGRVTFMVPAKLLVEGTNVIAASVHANFRGTPDLSYDLALTMPR